MSLFAAPQSDGGRLLEVEAPVDLARFIAAKGSIAMDGVSLTTNTATGRRSGRSPPSATVTAPT